MQEDSFLIIPVLQIRRFETQPREEEQFIRGDLLRLGLSIKYSGQVKPIIVRKLEEPDGDYLYELVDGERRLRACKLTGVTRIKAIVTYAKDELEQFKKSVIANFHARSHTHIAKYNLIMRLLDSGCTVKEVQLITNKSDAWVYEYRSLAKLPEKLRTDLLKGSEKRGELGFRAAVELAKLDNHDLIKKIYVEVLKLPLNLRNSKLKQYVEKQAPPVKRQKRPKDLTDYRRLVISFADSTSTKAKSVVTIQPDKMMQIMESMSYEERLMFQKQLQKCQERLTAIIDCVQNFKVKVAA